MRPLSSLVLLVVLVAAASAEATPRRRVYVALAPIANKANLPAELIQFAEEQLRAKVTALGGSLAPAGEDPKVAKAVVKKMRARAYELVAELSSLPDGGLRLSVVCFSYPERTLQGEVSVKGKGGKPKDLVRALAPKVIEEAAETFGWMP